MKSRLVIKIDPQIHKKLKIACIENDQTLTSFVVDAVEERLKSIKLCRFIKSRMQIDQ